jgi:hypothetical protein
MHVRWICGRTRDRVRNDNIHDRLGMATGISPSGNGSPSPSPRGGKFSVPVPADAHGGAFSPIPVPVGEFIPVGNPTGNLSPLELQYLKINLN